MRYAIISDLHANMQAWKVVYEDIQNNNVDRIICLGDIVGYGPNPAQLLREVRNNVDAVILGNHDAALCGKLDATLFNEDAQRLLEWTRKQVSADDLKFISSLPLTLKRYSYPIFYCSISLLSVLPSGYLSVFFISF